MGTINPLDPRRLNKLGIIFNVILVKGEDYAIDEFKYYKDSERTITHMK